MAKELTIQEDFDISTIVTPLFMLVMVMAVASITPVDAKAQQYYTAQSYTGLTDKRVLDVIPTLQWINLISDPPFTPWMSASFFNDGDITTVPSGEASAFIAINNPDELHEIAKGETFDVNMVGAQRRIEFVFYKSNPGERASVRAVGKY